MRKGYYKTPGSSTLIPRWGSFLDGGPPPYSSGPFHSLFPLSARDESARTDCEGPLPSSSSKKRQRFSNEERLMIAILIAAIEDIDHYRYHRTTRERLLYDNAERWLLSPDTTYPFSFLFICDTLGLDAGAARAAILSPSNGAYRLENQPGTSVANRTFETSTTDKRSQDAYNRRKKEAQNPRVPLTLPPGEAALPLPPGNPTGEESPLPVGGL